MGLNSENQTRSEKKLHEVHCELASTRLSSDGHSQKAGECKTIKFLLSVVFPPSPCDQMSHTCSLLVCGNMTNSMKNTDGQRESGKETEKIQILNLAGTEWK